MNTLRKITKSTSSSLMVRSLKKSWRGSPTRIRRISMNSLRLD